MYDNRPYSYIRGTKATPIHMLHFVFNFKRFVKVISHGPKFREPQHINWKHNFKIILMLLKIMPEGG